MHRSLVV